LGLSEGKIAALKEEGRSAQNPHLSQKFLSGEVLKHDSGVGVKQGFWADRIKAVPNVVFIRSFGLKIGHVG
jgi:hypothetical protein